MYVLVVFDEINKVVAEMWQDASERSENCYFTVIAIIHTDINFVSVENSFRDTLNYKQTGRIRKFQANWY